ncbi:MAG: sulfatase-like hydrolase/transferase [Anaerolineales bacterium]|nr:sulfatase-like hydrolase/transferase [Anaerolineales bacterium]
MWGSGTWVAILISGPVEFGFDEAIWCLRTADEVLWTMQSYFPNGPVTSAPYTGAMQIPPSRSRFVRKKKGAKAEVIATYDAKFRAEFDRKITNWAIDFMGRAKQDGKPFYMYLPFTQVHIPPIPDPEYARARPGVATWADLLDADGRFYRHDFGQARGVGACR